LATTGSQIINYQASFEALKAEKGVGGT